MGLTYIDGGYTYYETHFVHIHCHADIQQREQDFYRHQLEYHLEHEGDCDTCQPLPGQSRNYEPAW
jgi:hypothetical protein